MKTTLKVNNIKCQGCGTSIISKLSKIEGISEVEVDPNTREVIFESINDNLIDEVKQSLEKMGYTEGDPSTIQTAKSYVSCMIGKMK